MVATSPLGPIHHISFQWLMDPVRSCQFKCLVGFPDHKEEHLLAASTGIIFIINDLIIEWYCNYIRYHSKKN